MSLPKISIITPSFNQGKFIEETILSVINQNYPNLEYIIIDGGSTDNTIDIIKKYENKISYWISEKDKGQSDAINKGFKVASGEIIGWLNSDDLYLRPDISRNDEKSTLLCVAEAFTKNPEIDLIYGDVENFNDKGETEYYHVNEFEPLDFLKRVSIHQPSVFWRKKIIEETGYLDENLHYTMDYDLWMRIFFTYKTLKINKIISKFRIHNSSKTNSNPKDMYMEYRKVFSRFICSIEKTKYIELLKELRIYDNSE
ncbi:MAG: glycosyltransferase family 2 protein, partial [Bacteroidota bacterium]|nr:glycosyltransferase family 2 protein [Bacteroidota bacterium]